MALSIKATMVYPGATDGPTVYSIYADGTFDTDVDATYLFKVEQQQDLSYKEVSFVGVKYKNIGLGTLTVILIGTTDSQTETLVLGDNTKTKAYYNGEAPPKTLADGKSYLAMFSFHPLTDESYQVQLSRPANGGPLQIEQVTVFGESQEEPR